MNSQSARDPLGLLDPPMDDVVADDLHEMHDAAAGPSRRWRRTVEWTATSAPVALLLTIGIGLGPHGINLLTASSLSSLDPVVPVALAALGVLVGLGMGDRRFDEGRVLGAGVMEGALTLAAVSSGIALLTLAATWLAVPQLSAVALVMGICAATSLTLPTSNPLEPRPTAIRVKELGVLLPIAAGGLLLAWLRVSSGLGALALLAQTSGITLALAMAGWLLLTRTTSETDERVFAISALLLIGGVAHALGLSALFGGLVAGVFWRYTGGRPRETVRRDVLFVQHPLLVVVLLVAGARAELAPASLALGAAYVVLRVLGKLAGGAAARSVLRRKAPRDLGLHLLPPGVFGVAFALNAAAVLSGAQAPVLLTAVVVGTIASELVAVLLPPRSAEA